ncbi:MAG: hypothetical protein JXL97_11950 [Bacteroidales bacterium]|nr:hypothetical protein [Bacteroidales bacterium]
MLKRYISGILIFALIFSLQSLTVGCGCNNDEADLDDLIMDQNTTQSPVINEDAINEIISSFSSPVEMAALMSTLNVPFSKKYLVDPGLTENYDTNNKKAFALGVMSADLGYLNVYERSSLIVEYLSAIKRLSDDLKVSQFFDFQSFKRIATNNDNIDSLLFLSVQSFQNMDSYLRESGRSNLSLLAITGVWLEGLYLLTQVTEEKKSEKLRERIGEQKILFNMLYPILKIYKDDPYFESLVTDFKEFQKIYDEVKITYQVGEPETQVIDGHITIIQNEESIVEMTDEQLQQITLITEKIRNKLINL